MLPNHDSYDVIALYLSDIDCCYQEFLKELIKKCDFNLSPYIFELYASKNTPKLFYSKTLESISSCTNKNFRVKLIFKHIFSSIECIHPKDINELYEILICIEDKIITFLSEYFNSSPYIGTKHILNKIINEKLEHINNLKEYIAI